jgi:aerobic-type carbon monoxide dehydrogenase small subunit (CoxS/CutS family)
MPVFSREEVRMSDREGLERMDLVVNGEPCSLDVPSGTSLLTVLREHLGITSAKDGCAPQGQCGCCTVLVDGDARVACVTPIARVAGRSITTVEGLPEAERDALAQAFVGAGGSQCGFCTPGIAMRAAALRARGRSTRLDLDRALAAHLCRCTGWQTVYEAIEAVALAATAARDVDAASARASLEGDAPQRVRAGVPLGEGGFADDTAPRDALVAVPAAGPVDGPTENAAGIEWVVAETLDAARARAGKVQGRRTTVDVEPPLAVPDRVAGGVRLATSWVEPAYLEPDASWCEPGGEPATPLANGGAFGGKAHSPVTSAARELADRLGRPVRALFSREDVVRRGPKRPPIAATAVLDGERVLVAGRCAGDAALPTGWPSPYRVSVEARWEPVAVLAAVSHELRAVGLAEETLLVEGALTAAGADRLALVADGRAAATLLDACARAASGATAGARVRLDGATGALDRVEVKVAAGDPLDDVVLRSYAIGAVHQALGWVLTEGLAVDPDTADFLDLTIRSFGIIRPKSMPPVEVTIVDDAGPPLALASDAVFAATAAAAWNALAELGPRPETFPASGTAAARMLRR